MQDITSLTQLSTFDLIKDIIRTDTIFKNKFSSSQFYEFEPTTKRSGFKFPYIVIRIPGTDKDAQTIDRSVTSKNFEVNIYLVIDYSARDKFKDYASRLIKVLEEGESTFNSLGYGGIDVVLDDADTEYIQDKQCIAGNFTLTMRGVVSR